MSLTDIKIKSFKPSIKPDGSNTNKSYRVADEKGLYLDVPPSGNKRWRFRYRINGKEKLLSLGVYPEVSLKEARERRDTYRRLLRDGIDPSHQRKQQHVNANNFEAITREWHSKQQASWSVAHADRTLTRFEKNAFPYIGSKDINTITPSELLAMLRRVEDRGAIDTAHRLLQQTGQVFRYAIATGRAERNSATDLKGALPPVRIKHHASIVEPAKVGELMRAIHSYSGSIITATALKLAPYVFVRPGELRQAEWSEIDLKNAEWRIPAEKMKMGTVHIIPLSKQAITILNDIQPLTGRDKYVFPSNRTKERPISDNTLNASLRRLGYTKDEMTAHGFRSMASTLLNEQGWDRDAIERQLAHSERNGVRAAYNYAEYLPERKKMMQAWADYLDSLANGADIIAINSKGGK